MRIGCCLPGGSFMPQGDPNIAPSTEDILLQGDKAITELGFDYSECSVGMILQLTEEEAARLAEKRKNGQFHLEVCNCFIPGKYPIAAGEKRAELKEYVETAMARMHQLGVTVIVFGSGGARRIPETVTFEDGLAEIAEFLKMCNEVGKKYDVTVVIEPLNRKETNVLYTVAEGGTMARRVNCPYVQLLADAYHMYCEDEPLENLEKNADLLRHIHIAEVPERIYPGQHGGDYLKVFAETLKKIGYNGRVTAECHFDDFLAEIKPTYSFMRKWF